MSMIKHRQLLLAVLAACVAGGGDETSAPLSVDAT
jgi:hypothetical protein